MQPCGVSFFLLQLSVLFSVQFRFSKQLRANGQNAVHVNSMHQQANSPRDHSFFCKKCTQLCSDRIMHHCTTQRLTGHYVLSVVAGGIQSLTCGPVLPSQPCYEANRSLEHCTLSGLSGSPAAVLQITHPLGCNLGRTYCSNRRVLSSSPSSNSSCNA